MLLLHFIKQFEAHQNDDAAAPKNKRTAFKLQRSRGKSSNVNLTNQKPEEKKVLSKRQNSDNEPDNDDDSNLYMGSDTGIRIPLANGEVINLCNKKYVQILEMTHQKLKDLLVAACNGKSSK